jgi:hypothetical protein
VITGWGDEIDLREQSAAGVNWVVTKPFTADHIYELTRNVSLHSNESAAGVESVAA